MHELIDFVKFAKKNNVDIIHFMKMNFQIFLILLSYMYNSKASIVEKAYLCNII